MKISQAPLVGGGSVAEGEQAEDDDVSRLDSQSKKPLQEQASRSENTNNHEMQEVRSPSSSTLLLNSADRNGMSNRSILLIPYSSTAAVKKNDGGSNRNMFSRGNNLASSSPLSQRNILRGAEASNRTKNTPSSLSSGPDQNRSSSSSTPVRNNSQTNRSQGAGHSLSSSQNSSGESTYPNMPSYFDSPSASHHENSFGVMDHSSSAHSNHTKNTSFIRPKSSGLTRRGGHSAEEFTVDKLQFGSLSTLYGRQAEIKQLQELFAQVAGEDAATSSKHQHSTSSRKLRHQKRTLATVRGPAGAGKSALVHQSLSSVVPRAQGFYGTGKFHQQQQSNNNNHTVPFQAMAQACEQIVDDLIQHKRRSQFSIPYKFTHQEFRRRLLDEYLDLQQVHLLQTLVSNLSELLGVEQDSDSASPMSDRRSADKHVGPALSRDNSENLKENHHQVPAAQEKEVTETDNTNFAKAKQRFRFAFLQFFRLVSSFGPVCLVLDDCQWADAPTLELVHAIATDDEDGSNRSSNKPIGNSPKDKASGTEATPGQSDAGNSKRIRTKSESVRNRGILIIAMFRDSEVDDDHILSRMIGALREREQERRGEMETNQPSHEPLVGMPVSVNDNSSTVTLRPSLQTRDIELQNLKEDDLTEMLSDLLFCKPEQVRGLAKLTHAKTMGNALYMKQFLLSLSDDGLLQYNFGRLAWIFDLEQIKIKAASTDNVADLLKQKLQKLPNSIQQILPQVACLGNPFLDSMFHLLAEKSAASTDGSSEEREEPSGKQKHSALELCVKEGLLVHCGHGWYKWEHDRLQEASYLHGERDDVDLLQFAVGKVLLDGLSESDLSTSALFTVCNLLNCGIGRAVKRDSNDNLNLRLKAALLNLRAGKSVFEVSAYDNAMLFLKNGWDWLPSCKWEAIEYKYLSLDLISTLAEAEYCVGKFEDMKKHCDEVLQLPLSVFPLLERRRFYNVIASHLSAQGKLREAIALCLDVLEKLGCKFPKRARALHAKAGVLRAMMSLKSSSEQIASLSPSTDPKMKWTFDLLFRVIHLSYQNDPDLCPLAILKAHRLTLTHGTSDYSAPILSTTALMLAGKGEFQGGKMYADHALRLMTRSVESRTVFVNHFCVLHWQIPFEACRQPLLRAYDVGLRTGDVESALLSINAYIEITFYSGGSLESLLDDCQIYARQAEQFAQHHVLELIRMCWQMVHNIATPDSQRHLLKGHIMDEDQILENIEKTKDPITKLKLNRFRIYLAFWYCKYHRVVDIMLATGTHKFVYDKALPGLVGIGPLYCYCALSCIHVCRDTGHPKYKKYALAFFEKIKMWCKKGNPNFWHMERLIEAELEALQGKKDAAARNFESALLLAGRRGLVADQAYVHERCAVFADRTDDKRYHREKAMALYQEFGAYGKLATIPNSAYQESMPFTVSVDSRFDDWREDTVVFEHPSDFMEGRVVGGIQDDRSTNASAVSGLT